MIHQRTPAVAESVVTALGQEEQLGGCVGELQEAAERLDHEGFWWRPVGRHCEEEKDYLS